MSIHTRPPAQKRTPEMTSNTIVTSQPRPEPQPVTEPTGGRPSEIDPHVEPIRPAEARVERAAEGTSPRWYRREPWLAVMLVAFVPLIAAVVAPDAAQYPLIGLTVLALIAGAAMLIRQGVFGAQPGSKLHRE